MTDLNVQLILRLVDRATAPARAALAGINRLGAGVMARAQAAQTQAMALGSALGGAAGAATRTSLALSVIGGLSLRSFTNQAAEFERFNVQLTNLEGSSEGAARAMAWIEDFATRTPLQVDQTVAAYTRLRAFGIDPTNGTMQALVDTMAATGGTAEQLDGLVLALGQAWTKGKLQGEEALQMLERGVPVYDLLAKQLGVTTEEVIRMQSAGELGREEIALLIEALGEANAGAAEDMSKTWDGIISNLVDHWQRFQRQVMASDLFAWMKARLVELLDTLNRLAADGTLLRWAQDTAAVIIRIFEGIAGFARSVANVWNDWSPTINRIVEALGGMENVIVTLIALRFAPWIWAATRAIFGIAAALGLLRFSRSAGALAAVADAAGTVGPQMDRAARATQAATDRMNSAIRGLNWRALGAGLGAGLALASVPEFEDQAAMEEWQEKNRTALDQNLRATPVIGNLMSGYEKLRDWVWDKPIAPDGVKTVDEWLANAESRMPTFVAAINNWLAQIKVPPLALDVAAGDGLSPYRTYPGSTGFRWPDGTTGAAQPSDGPGRATGGPVRAGMIYRWQEQGEEFFRPRVDGTVINAQGTAEMRRSRAATVLNLGGITINASPGMSPDAIARAVRREIARLAEGSGTELHDGGLYAR